MKTFHCNRCQNLVFFENTQCGSCDAVLGYIPPSRSISAFEPADNGTWRSLDPNREGERYKQCQNYALENVCNWMLPADSEDSLCSSCRLTHTIPNLSLPDNRFYWYQLEAAKRRLLYTLAELGLRTDNRRIDPEGGLQFDFLEDAPSGAKVLTGHDNGLITMNVAEADDATREKMRAELREPYRTLLGHFRHEIGHYYFDRLITGTDWEEPFRALFGDERADYAQAMQNHYANGAPADWANNYVSAYATMHPWEDWAETWAHYLHIVDTIDTAAACGLSLSPEREDEPTLEAATPVELSTFDRLMKQWFPLTYALNSLNRSLGNGDAYPFTLAPQVIEKLRFVHRVVHRGQRSNTGMAPQSAPAGANDIHPVSNVSNAGNVGSESVNSPA